MVGGDRQDEPTTRQMLGEMLRLTEAADTRLDEQAEAFARLRDLENTAPAGARGARPADRRAARRASRRRSSGWPSCSSASPPSAVAPVADNVTEAQARLAAAEQEVQRGAATPWAPAEPGDAVGDIRAAEDAVAQTATLLDAVGRLATDLDAAGAPGRGRAGRDGEGPRRGAVAGRRRATRSGLGPQIARAEAALTSADAALGRPTARRRPAGRPAAAGGGRHRAGAGAVGGPRRPGPDPARGRRPGPGAAHRALDHRGGGRLHRHPPGRGRPGGAHPAGRGAAAPRPRRRARAATTRSAPCGRRTRPATMAQSALDLAQARRLAVVRRRLRRRPRWLRRRLRRRVPAGAASTSAAWCSAGSCWAAGAAGSAAVGSAVAAASAAVGAAVGRRRQLRRRWRPERRRPLLTDRRTARAPGNCRTPVGRCPPRSTRRSHAHPRHPLAERHARAGSTTAQPTSTPRRPSTRPSSAGSTPAVSRSSAAT